MKQVHGSSTLCLLQDTVTHFKSAWGHSTLPMPIMISFKLQVLCDHNPDEAPLAIFAGPDW